MTLKCLALLPYSSTYICNLVSSFWGNITSISDGIFLLIFRWHLGTSEDRLESVTLDLTTIFGIFYPSPHHLPLKKDNTGPWLVSLNFFGRLDLGRIEMDCMVFYVQPFNVNSSGLTCSCFTWPSFNVSCSTLILVILVRLFQCSAQHNLYAHQRARTYSMFWFTVLSTYLSACFNVDRSTILMLINAHLFVLLLSERITWQSFNGSCPASECFLLWYL